MGDIFSDGSEPEPVYVDKKRFKEMEKSHQEDHQRQVKILQELVAELPHWTDKDLWLHNFIKIMNRSQQWGNYPLTFKEFISIINDI